jgi:hypothetical protein
MGRDDEQIERDFAKCTRNFAPLCNDDRSEGFDASRLPSGCESGLDPEDSRLMTVCQGCLNGTQRRGVVHRFF